jgi:hypothetical protein
MDDRAGAIVKDGVVFILAILCEAMMSAFLTTMKIF